MHLNAQESPSPNERSRWIAALQSGESVDTRDDVLAGLVAAVVGSEEWVQGWEEVREYAVGRMQNSELGREIRIKWAHVAMFAIARKGGSSQGQVSVAEEARIRSYLICTFGSSVESGLRNLRDLYESVIPAIGATRKEVLVAAQDWQKSEVMEILRLRRIKNLLMPLDAVYACLREEAKDPEVGKWLEVLPRLP